MNRRPAALLILLTSLLLAQPARAETLDLPGVATATDVVLPAELARLELEAPPAVTWWWGWTLGYAGLAAVQGAGYALIHDEQTRPQLLVGAAGSVLGVAGMFLNHVRDVGEAQRVLRDAPDDAARQKLARTWLPRARDAEIEGRRWLNHALCLAVGVASGVVLWRVYDQPGRGVMSALAGVAVGEAQLLSQPTGLLQEPRATWQVTPAGAGVAVTGRF